MCQKERFLYLSLILNDMTGKTLFREFMGDYPGIRLLEFLIEGRFFDYTLTDISEKSGVSWRTLHRIWPNFVKNKIVIVTREIGRIKLYKLNTENTAVMKLVELFDNLLERDINRVGQKVQVVKKVR
jgi:DNA-binding transcriptional ArsR family regulator